MRLKLQHPLLWALALGLLTSACGPSDSGDTATEATEQVVNVYSSRHYDTDDELYRRFTEETGIEVQLIEADSAALLERIAREGNPGTADIFLAVDAGRLHQAEDQDIFEPIESSTLNELVPENLRHPEGLWFGLTKRARVIVYSKERVDPTAIARYEDLADPAWKGKVLVRSSTNIYNQSLMGSILAAAGEEEAENWCRGLAENFARPPQGGDRDQVRAVAAGEGDIAIANSYYLARMASGSEEDQEAFSKIGVIHPNQEDRGTHVNLSGAGVVRGAPNRENAIRFLEFLASDEVQKTFAEAAKEYPVNGDHSAVVELADFGSFREDSLNASVFGALNQEALMIMDRCGWR